jgi:FkbM family methyltransferase
MRSEKPSRNWVQHSSTSSFVQVTKGRLIEAAEEVCMLGWLVWRVRVLFRYIRKFGFFTGFRVFWKIYTHPLSTHESSKTLQLSFYGHPVNVRLRTSDVSVFQGIFLEGAYDLSFLNLNPKTIIDGGANVGFSSIFFAHAYPQARIFAIEPEESNFRMLLENTKFYPNIVPIRAALWHREGKLRIENLKADKWSFTVTESTENEDSGDVDALTIDRLLAMSETETIDVLKLDIEGAEAELFCANYENWIEKTSVIIIELHDRFRKGCSDAFYSATARHNFQKKERQEHVILFKKPEV